jgi:PepSY-associated TM region
MIRVLLLLHRYLGIAVGVLMVMWCLSGVVMMYVSYPSLGEGDRLRHLEPLEWTGCCKISEALLSDAGEFQVEMLAGRPVLNAVNGSMRRPIDLRTGVAVEGVTALQAAAIAGAFGTGTATPTLLGLIDHDQWTVAGGFDAQRPLYHFALGDEARTEVYVSSVTGRALQVTTAHERFWNWLGSVPHWLYFTQLRRHASLWSQVVIYTSLIGCFLTVIGIYLGVYQLAVQPAGRWSPYRGFNLWHHMAGLCFGVFALTWVSSGLLSMNPWGWLAGSGAHSEIEQLRGAPPPTPRQMATALQALADTHPAGAVSIKSAPLNGRIYFTASNAGGERRRLDAAGAATPLSEADMQFLASTLERSDPPVVPRLIATGDDFYFSHHSDPVALPVYQLIRAGSGTRYYVDPVSGMLIAKIDRNAQAYRWLHQGLHRIDLMPALRSRPGWDTLMLVLLSGVTLSCLTGTYLGFRRLLR